MKRGNVIALIGMVFWIILPFFFIFSGAVMIGIASGIFGFFIFLVGLLLPEKSSDVPPASTQGYNSQNYQRGQPNQQNYNRGGGRSDNYQQPQNQPNPSPQRNKGSSNPPQNNRQNYQRQQTPQQNVNQDRSRDDETSKKLKRLKELKEKGIITEEEFQREMDKVLD